MSIRIGISTSYEGLVFNDEVYPVRISGDILQAYWIIDFLREYKNMEFKKIDKNNDINHFFYLPSLSYLDEGMNFGFNPNFFDLSKYGVFTSSSWFSRIFSYVPYFRKVYSFYKRRKFMGSGGVFLKKNLRLRGLRYIIFNSNREKNEFEKFLRSLKIEIEVKDFYVIYNPLNYQEIDYLINDLDFSVFERIRKDYGLSLNYGIFVGRFDRIKNLDRFVSKYISRGLDKQIPFVIAGKVMDYDRRYYQRIEEIVRNRKNIFILNMDDLSNRYLGDFVKFLPQKFGMDKRKYLLGRKMVLELIKFCSFLVVPSWVESFGFTVLEAIYLNKPVIVTRNSPYEEVLPELIGKNIKIIDPLVMNLDLDLFVFRDFENSGNLIKKRFGIEKIALDYMEVWKKYG